MKKIITVLIIALVFTSCAGRMNPDNLNFNKSFSFTTEIEFGGAASTAEFTRTAIGEWEGVLTAPYALQGMRVMFTPTEMTVSYSDFVVDLGDESPPEINVSAFVMIKTLESAFMMQDVNVTAGKDSIEVAGMFDGNAYVLRLDKDGMPALLEVPGRQLRVNFTGATAVNFRLEPLPSLE
jgi:hypothetical protein